MCVQINRLDIRRKLGNKNYISSGDITVKEFAGVINEFRNCAVHQGGYWKPIFNDFNDNTPQPITVEIDTEKFSRNNKVNHVYEVTMKYSEFEDIFVRTCIRFISDFIEND